MTIAPAERSLRRDALRGVAAVLLGASSLAAAGRAQSYTQTWTFNEQTTGGNIAWTAPTAVYPTASVYQSSYQITSVIATVKYLFLTFPVDVTAEVPPEQLAGGGPLSGPAPVTIFDNSITYPDPPAPTTIAAHLTSGINAGGFGTFTATDIVLGTAVVDTGIFGMQTVQLTKIQIAGSLTIHATWFDLHQPLAGTQGTAQLVGSGPLVGGQLFALELSNALPGGSAYLVAGFSNLNAPFKGGILGPSADILVAGLPLDAGGNFTLAALWPVGLPANFSLYFQEWFADPGGPHGFAASNTLRAVTP